MKNLFKIIALTSLLISIIFFIPSCATIFKGTTKSISIESNLSNVEFKVVDYKNYDITSGKTPTTIDLKKKNAYSLKFKLAGYKEKTVAITPSPDLFMYGNILFEVPALILGLSVKTNETTYQGAYNQVQKASDAAKYLAIGGGIALIGVLVDYFSGGGFDLDPDKIFINLESVSSSNSRFRENIYASIKFFNTKGESKEIRIPLEKEKK